MLQNNNINITDSDIKYAEKNLLKEWQSFDTERRDFIKNLDTIDLQAVPWSWKTTALLAKLLILEKKMPFSDWSGILVLSHTNTAVDEIKERIWKIAPKLFNFPNFIWTIQSFIDEFLAKPFFVSKVKTGINFIDSDRYKNLIEKQIYYFYKWISIAEKTKINHIKNWNPKLIYESTLFLLNGSTELFLEWKQVEIKKPRWNTRPQNYIDYSNIEKTRVYKALIKVKQNLILSWNLSFEDAYYLWDKYVEQFPKIKNILQSRFKYVFVDEMQDMWEHQIKILENIFYKKYILKHSFQRIWDINQAIYWWSVKAENLWTNNWRKKLEIIWTHRLTKKTANVVKNFWLEYIEFNWKRKIINNSDEDISMKPILLVYNNIHLNNSEVIPEIKENKILEKFSEIIKNKKDEWYFKNENNLISKAIIWSAKSDTGRNWILKFQIDKCRAKHYFYDYNVTANKSKNKIWFKSYKDYLYYYDKNHNTYKSKYNNLVNLFLSILRDNEFKHPDNNRNFNKTSLLRYLKVNHNETYTEFNTFIYNCVKKLNNLNIDEIAELIESYFPKILNVLPWTQKYPLIIKNLDLSEESVQIDNTENKGANLYSNNWININICNVHSVKWETHTCTLYMETSSHWYESFPKLTNKPYLGKWLAWTLWVRGKEAAKMLYVWLSRPTHLLCYAIHKNRYDKLIEWEWNEGKLNDLWNIEYV